MALLSITLRTSQNRPHIFLEHAFPLDRENFLFTMDSWESYCFGTKRTEAFQTYFANSATLIPPKLVFEVNSAPFIRKSTTAAIDVVLVSSTPLLPTSKREMSDFRREQMENNSLVQRQVAALHTNMENSDSSSCPHWKPASTIWFLPLLAGRDEKAIESRIASIDSSLAFELMCLRGSCNDDEKRELLNSLSQI